jgi:hypothetical protein
VLPSGSIPCAARSRMICGSRNIILVDAASDILVMLVTGVVFDAVLLGLRDRLIPWHDESERN